MGQLWGGGGVKESDVQEKRTLGEKIGFETLTESDLDVARVFFTPERYQTRLSLTRLTLCAFHTTLLMLFGFILA